MKKEFRPSPKSDSVGTAILLNSEKLAQTSGLLSAETRIRIVLKIVRETAELRAVLS